MIKFLLGLMLTLLFACNSKNEKEVKASDEPIIINDSTTIPPPDGIQDINQEISSEYKNDRFRKVTVEKVAPNKFRIQGEAQVFEANFSWVIEDGHNELKKGFETTQAGAPEWGKFDFTVEYENKNPHSTLHLILFEISAKDGSPQHQLPVLLE